jgi:hypothetical protein
VIAPLSPPAPAGHSRLDTLARITITFNRANIANNLCIVEGVPHRVRLMRAGSVDLSKSSREGGLCFRARRRDSRLFVIPCDNHGRRSLSISCAHQAREGPGAPSVSSSRAGARNIQGAWRRGGTLQSSPGSPRAACYYLGLHCRCSSRLTDWNLRRRAGGASLPTLAWRKFSRECCGCRINAT